MFDRETITNDRDPLRAQFQGMKGKLCASPELKAALITGTPLHTPAVGKRVHVRRFTKAIAVYAMCALLLLGTAIALPSLLKGMDPTSASSSTGDHDCIPPAVAMSSPSQLYERLLSEPNVVYREVGTIYFQDGSVKTSHVTEMTRRGDLFTTLNYGDGEPEHVRYYDVGGDKPCVYYNRNDLWFTSELRGDNATWAHWCKAYMAVNWLEDEHYEKTADGYKFTEEFIAEQIEEFKCEDAEGTLTFQDGVYTLRVVRHKEQFREEPCESVFEIQISFGNAPEIVLPEATICTHEYEVEVIPSDHPCRYGDETRYTCKICNDWYNEWSPTVPHNIVDGICTGCKLSEEEIGNLPDDDPDNEDHSDIIYGPYVEMSISRPSMQEFLEFYTVFQRKNTAPIVVTDLGDQKNSITQYHFYGGIINKNTFPDDYDYDYSSGEIRVPIQFWYSFYYNCDDAYFGTYDYGIVAENYTLDNDAVIDLDNIRLERVSTGMETFSAKHELSAKGKKEGEIRYYEIYSGENRLMKFAICAVASTEDSYYDSICQQVVDGLVKLG